MTETDLFKRIENIGLQKWHIQQDSPLVFDFLTSCVQEESIEVKNMIKKKVDLVYSHGLEKIYKSIDYSKFREGLDIEKAIEILNWTMFGFGEKALLKIETFKDSSEFGEQYMKEWEGYVQILKQCFYKAN